MFDRLKHAFRSPRKAAARVRRVTPVVDGLEARALLTTVPSALAPKLVTELYTDLFHRQVTPGELSYNVKALRDGEPVEDLVHKLVTSSERKALEVVAYYQSYLGRDPDLGGLVYQLGLLNNGITPVQVQQGIIASPEFQNAHATNTSYIDALYLDVLGRPAAAGDLTYWTTALNDGTSRAKMAQTLFGSKEYAALVINSDYNLVLNRDADAGAVKYWTPNVLSTQKDGDLLVALFTSTENFNDLAKLP